MGQLEIDFMVPTVSGSVVHIETERVHRNVTFRISRARKRQWRLICGTGGAVRKIWNILLDETNAELREYMEAKERGESPESV